MERAKFSLEHVQDPHDPPWRSKGSTVQATTEPRLRCSWRDCCAIVCRAGEVCGLGFKSDDSGGVRELSVIITYPVVRRLWNNEVLTFKRACHVHALCHRGRKTHDVYAAPLKKQPIPISLLINMNYLCSMHSMHAQNVSVPKESPPRL